MSPERTLQQLLVGGRIADADLLLRQKLPHDTQTCAAGLARPLLIEPLLVAAREMPRQRRAIAMKLEDRGVDADAFLAPQLLEPQKLLVVVRPLPRRAHTHHRF